MKQSNPNQEDYQEDNFDYEDDYDQDEYVHPKDRKKFKEKDMIRAKKKMRREYR
jgi:hypothetical protein